MTYHLAILKKQYLDMILSGAKPVESRFTKSKKPPFGQVQVGDTIFLKESSGPVCAIAEVKKVETYPNLTAEKMLELKQKYNHLIKGADDYWQQITQWSRFATLIWLKPPLAIPPRRISKQDMRGWVVLTEKQNYGLVKNGKVNL